MNRSSIYKFNFKKLNSYQIIYHNCLFELEFKICLDIKMFLRKYENLKNVIKINIILRKQMVIGK